MFIKENETLYICGIDEAGRGPLAGPVVAGAVVLPENFPVELLNDSKKLSEKKRDILEPLIKENAVAWGIGLATHDEIDSLNILKATLLAMKRAFNNMIEVLKKSIDITDDDLLFNKTEAIVDGISYPDLPVKMTVEPRADGTYPSVMAASIIAKTYRDKIMKEYAKIYPEYEYEKHKGYPTARHMEICRRIGPSPIQRKTFKY